MTAVMTGRERVARAIERRYPDCIPVLHKIQDGALYEHGEALYRLAARCPADNEDLTAASRPIPRPDPMHFVPRRQNLWVSSGMGNFPSV